MVPSSEARMGDSEGKLNDRDSMGWEHLTLLVRFVNSPFPSNC